MLEGLRSKLSGKKTYLIGIGSIIGALVGWANGAVSSEQTMDLIIQAILAMTVRAGVKSSQ